MSGFQLQRLGQIMEPEPGNPLEVEGVLNPAAACATGGRAVAPKCSLLIAAICRQRH